MKTIKKGLDEAYQKAGVNAYFGNGFQAGVDFATQWNSINTPPSYGIPLLLKFVNGSYEVGYYLQHRRRDDDFYSFIEPDIEFKFEAVTHWRLIEFK